MMTECVSAWVCERVCACMSMHSIALLSCKWRINISSGLINLKSCDESGDSAPGPLGLSSHVWSLRFFFTPSESNSLQLPSIIYVQWLFECPNSWCASTDFYAYQRITSMASSRRGPVSAFLQYTHIYYPASAAAGSLVGVGGNRVNTVQQPSGFFLLYLLTLHVNIREILKEHVNLLH